MIKIYIDEEIEKYYQNLPPILKDALYDTDIADKIFDIGKTSGLMDEKIKILAEETGYVVLGLTRPMDFVERLADGLKLDHDKICTIAKEINHQIFFPMREALKIAHQTEVSEDEIERGATMMKKAPVQPSVPKITTPPPFPPPAIPKTPEEPPKPMPPSQVFPQKIMLEKKPELNLPPSKIPPIDLRNQKEQVARPYSPPTTTIKTAPEEKPIETSTATIALPPPPASPSPAPKKNSYDERDPYKEPVE